MQRSEYTAETCAGVLAACGVLSINLNRPNSIYVAPRVVADMGDTCLACSSWRGIVNASGIFISWMSSEGEWLPMNGMGMQGYASGLTVDLSSGRLRLLILCQPGVSILCNACLPLPELTVSELENLLSAEKRVFDEVAGAYHRPPTPGCDEEHEALDTLADMELTKI